jgi:hypothetical protein
MKTLKTSKPLLNLKGKPFKNEDGSDFTVGEAMANTLAVSKKNPHKCYQLAKMIAENEEVDLKAEDVVFIKEVLNESGNNAITSGQLIAILEENDKETKKSEEK